MSELHVADGAEMFHWCSQEQGRSAELIKQGSEEKTETVLVYLQGEKSTYKLVEAGVGGRLSRHNLPSHPVRSR